MLTLKMIKGRKVFHKLLTLNVSIVSLLVGFMPSSKVGQVSVRAVWISLLLLQQRPKNHSLDFFQQVYSSFPSDHGIGPLFLFFFFRLAPAQITLVSLMM